MPDYGHDLLFGAFVTPSATGVAHTLAVTAAADRAGLDLVTYQDHPYQAAFLDTWTLMAYAAARTERVHLAGNVLNLPLRPRRCWRSPSRRSTSSPAAGSSSVSGRGPSGTPSRPPGVGG